MGQQSLIVHLMDALTQPEEVLHTYKGIFWERLQHRNHASPLLLQGAAQIGHYHDVIKFLLRKLSLYLESAEAIYLIAKEIDTEGVF